MAELYINPYSCTSCLLVVNSFDKLQFDLEKKILFSEKLTTKEIEAFLKNSDISTAYGYFNNDSLYSSGLKEFLNKGILKLRTEYGSFILKGDGVADFLSYPQLYFAKYYKLDVGQLGMVEGPSYFNFDQFNKGIFLINRNLGIDTIAHFISNELSYSYGPSSTFIQELYVSIHGDSSGFYKWLNLRKLLQSVSNMSMVNLYEILPYKSNSLVFGTFYDRESPKSETHTVIPRYFVALLEKGQLVKPVYVPSNGNIIERFKINEENQLYYTLGKHVFKDSCDLLKGIVGYQVQLNRPSKHKRIKLPRKLLKKVSDRVLDYDYLSIEDRTIVIDSTLYKFNKRGYSIEDYNAMYTNLTYLAPKANGVIACRVSDNDFFEVNYKRFDSNKAITVFRIEKSKIKSNVVYKSNFLSFITDDKKLLSLVL
jgi:hypothetical protein